MPDAVFLDTSAFFTFLQNEAGAEIVEKYLLDAKAGNVIVHASFATLTEVEYITAQERSATDAAHALAKITAWPVTWHHTSEALCSEAAKLKAMYKLSFADSFVAASAKRAAALLVHKDPEFDALNGIIKLLTLPPKIGRAKSGLS